MTDRFLDRFAEEVARRVGPVGRLERELRALTEGFTGRRGARPPDYLRDARFRAAYLASFAIPNAARARRLLAAAGAGLGPGERGLDAGAGVGSAALALASLSHPASEIVLADRSGPALEEAASLFAALFPDGPRIRTARLDLAGRAPPPPGPFRTVVASYLLNELLPARGRGPGPALPAARGLASRTANDGALVLIEPAQRIPSRALCAIRAELIADGYRPLGPCTHANRCPVLEPRATDWCVVDVPFEPPPVVQAVDRLLGTRRERLTASWLGLSRAAAPPAGRRYEVLS